MRYYTIAEESVHAMPRAIDELIGNHEFERLMLFFQRSDGGDRKNSLNAELFEPIIIRTEIQFARQDPMAAPMPCQECDCTPSDGHQHKTSGGPATRRLRRTLHTPAQIR